MSRTPDTLEGVRVGIELADLSTRLAVAAAATEPGRLGSVHRARIERPPAPEMVIERVAELAKEAGGPEIAHVGLAVWAPIDRERGAVTDPRYGTAWRGFPFAHRLSEALHAPVTLMAGVHAAARGEALAGAGVGRSPLLFAHLGRNITDALLVDGEVVQGAHGAAGRLGHWQTGLDGPRCACGQRGHLDPLASAQSLVRLAIGAAADDEPTLAAIHAATGMRAEALTVPQLVRLARDGATPLRELLDYAIDALSGALANLVVTLDPDVIIIGGPLALADGVFLDWLRERLSVCLDGVGDVPTIAAAALEPHGALAGAAWS